MRSEAPLTAGAGIFMLSEMPSGIVEAKHLTPALDIFSRYAYSVSLAPVKLLHPDPEKAISIARRLVFDPRIDASIPEKVLHREPLFTVPGEGGKDPDPDLPLHVLLVSSGPRREGSARPRLEGFWMDHQAYDVPSDRFVEVAQNGPYETRAEAEENLGAVRIQIRAVSARQRSGTGRSFYRLHYYRAEDLLEAVNLRLKKRLR